MNVPAAALRELHRIHTQLADLRDRLERGPRQVQAREANVAKLTTQLQTARENALQTRMTVDRKQLDLKAGEQKIVDLRAKLNMAATNKEYQALLEQIAAAEMAGSVLSDEILEGFEKIDQLEASVKEADSRLQSNKHDLEKTRTMIGEAAETVRADVTRLERELATAEANLPTVFKADYARVIRSKGADGLAVVDDSVCTG
jgi:predicted  nucleic acid-binding Zn-ribbon protein